MERLLGQGGQAEVWLAFDEELHELVALKLFESSAVKQSRRRIRREVRIGRMLRHPNLVRVFDHVEADDRLGVTMEYLPGGTLAQRVVDGPLPLDAVERVAGQVLEALAYLHGKRVVHRDVKPSNLLLDANGDIHLGDLGLVFLLDEKGSGSRTVNTVGTPRYMSPEQASGQPLTPASDLYSLGATLFHLLAGAPPFEVTSVFDAVKKHVEEEPPSPRRLRQDCPLWLARFILRLLEKKPADRYADAAEALAALRKRSARLSPRQRRRLLLWGGAAALVGALGFAGAHWGPDALGAPEAVETVVEGQALRGVDAKGRVIWTYEAPSTIRQVERANVLGDAADEVIIAARPDVAPFRTGSKPPAEVAVLSLSGHMLSVCRPEALVPSESTLIAPAHLVPHIVLLDRGLQGPRDLVLNCRHQTLDTAYLFFLSPEHSRWSLILTHYGGWIFDLVALPGIDPPVLRFSGFNVAIGFLPVVGELRLATPSGTRAEQPLPLPGARASGSTLSWYTPIEQASPSPVDSVPGFQLLGDGSSLFAFRGERRQVDRFGNPVPGPNAGRDLAPLRLQLLMRLEMLRASSVRGRRTVMEAIAAIRRDFAPLLSEAPTRAVLAYVSTGASCAVGTCDESVRDLLPVWEELGYEGLGLALAHAQALSGDLSRAATTLQRLNENASTPAGWFRAPQLLVRVAIEEHSRERFELAARMFADDDAVPPRRRVLEARYRLWWDELVAGDDAVPSLDTVPEGEAISCLARWRLGKTRAEDIEVMRGAILRNPDAKAEGHLARAMALLALGRSQEALAELDICDMTLTQTAHSDFNAHQVSQLARACRAKALVAAGREAEAAALARSLQPTLRPRLLPAILCQEVLREAGVDAH